MESQTQKIKAFELQDVDNWVKQLHECGCIVLRNIISPQEVTHTVDLFWEWMQALGSGIKRNDASTWSDNNWPAARKLGFFVSYGGCHTKASWFVRTHPRVRQAFSEIWSCNDLVTSFDTIISWRSWWNAAANGKWNPFVENLHVDQNPAAKKGLCCVQGMIPLRRVRKDEVGGLMVVPYTNNDETQKQIVERYPQVQNYNSDWVELHANDPFIGKGVLVECEAGDLILWDSRTVHGGKVNEPNEQFKTKNQQELVRLALTVTMVPRSWASQHILDKRKDAFINHIGTTHWPHEFNKNPMGSMSVNIIKQNIHYDWPQLQGQILKLV